MMLFKTFKRFSVSRPILKAYQSYKNSATQRKIHEFDQNEAQIRKIKNQLDHQTIDKESEGYIMIREFLFQQKKAIYQANYQGKYLVPSGKWSIKEMEKMLQIQESRIETPSENENTLILSNFQKDLQQKLIKYYNNIGKKDYTFSVNEQIQKIESMTPEEFEEFMLKLKD